MLTTTHRTLLSDSVTAHYTAELELLGRAAQGDGQAMHAAIQYLSSANPHLREIMLAALHECVDPAVWHGLVRCTAERCWEQGLPDQRLLDGDAARRLDESVVLAFTQDHTTVEGDLKTAALHTCLSDQDLAVRHAAACLLGLRGDMSVFPALGDVLARGEPSWKLRAIQALVHLNDARCGPLLLKALQAGTGVVHQEAGRAICKLASTIRKTLVESLDDPHEHVRWHVARTLLEIGDPSGVDVVVQGLFHQERVIRFASAEALASLGEQSVLLLLSVLSRPGLSQPTMQAIGHAFNSIESHAVRERVRPLLQALQDPTTSTVVPSIAQQMLAVWPHAIQGMSHDR
ncbi:MAG: HEAT repeat domain-containing protein [Chloroflexota bacterium]